ncbi:MAG: hypothetical protein PHW27_10610 [Melioribacteraceae bacterium]|nr:hypothetical protein [Melioribacteraceae bacterium]
MNLLKNISIIFLLSSFLFSFIISCDSTDPKPPEKPPGYQEDIPWPSLADSPWPIYRGNQFNNGRSKFRGPSGSWLKSIDSIMTFSSISVDETGNYYFLGAGTNTSGLYSFSYSGEFRWCYNLSQLKYQGNTSPIQLNGGEIIFSYFSNPKSKVVKIDTLGRSIWELETDMLGEGSLSIDKNGNIYSIKQLYPYNLIEITSNGDIVYESIGPVFSPNCSFLVFSPSGDQIYGSNINEELVAFDITSKSIIWEIGKVSSIISPTIDSDGNIYCFMTNQDSTFLTKLNSGGEIKWKKILDSSHSINLFNYFDLTIDKLGRVITQNYKLVDDIYEASLIAFNYNGGIDWELDGIVLGSSVSIDVDNNFFFTSRSANLEHIFFSINQSGNVRWSQSYGNTLPKIDNPIAIGINGSCLINTTRSNDIQLFK